ncbi:MAG: hypothetical protein IJ769_00500 [Clostridia bacterium]|nr:hypothetical protein [Clostridia bacterium]
MPATGRGDAPLRFSANCCIRAKPNVSGVLLGVAKRGSVLTRGDAAAENGWLPVAYRGQTGWAHGRFLTAPNQWA